jgi:hypothetical protein
MQPYRDSIVAALGTEREQKPSRQAQRTSLRCRDREGVESFLGEQLAGVELAIQTVGSAVEKLAEDVKSVQADLATLKRRKVG